MVYCVQLFASFGTAARRDNVLADIQARIAGKPRWSVDLLEAADLRPKLGQYGLRAELRFVSRLDADDLKTRVETFATGTNAPQPGSHLIVHDCTHDEGTNDCLVVARRDW